MSASPFDLVGKTALVTAAARSRLGDGARPRRRGRRVVLNGRGGAKLRTAGIGPRP